jgi:hypothetical protein
MVCTLVSLNSLVSLSNLESVEQQPGKSARRQQCQETQASVGSVRPSPVAVAQHTIGKRGILTVKSACERRRMTAVVRQ